MFLLPWVFRRHLRFRDPSRSVLQQLRLKPHFNSIYKVSQNFGITHFPTLFSLEKTPFLRITTHFALHNLPRLSFPITSSTIIPRRRPSSLSSPLPFITLRHHHCFCCATMPVAPNCLIIQRIGLHLYLSRDMDDNVINCFPGCYLPCLHGGICPVDDWMPRFSFLGDSLSIPVPPCPSSRS